MSLYGDYVLEREGKGIVEKSYGFATYKIRGDECYICDIYIKPDYRKKGVGSHIANEIAEIAKENKCKYLTGTVCPSLNGATQSLIAQLNYGFKILSSHEDLIVLKKEL